MQLRTLIKQARGEMSQMDFAFKCGTTHQSLGQWERGEALPSIGKLRKLAPLLNIHYADLIEIYLKEKLKKEGYNVR